MELDRAKTVAEVAQVLVNSAKAEVEFMRVAGRITGTDFIPLGDVIDHDALPAPRRPQ